MTVSSTTFEHVLAALADSQASAKEARTALLEPTALSGHLRFSFVLAGASLVAVVALLFAARFLPMTEKQVMLVSVVSFAAAGLFFIALLSAGTAAGAAYARQHVALHQAHMSNEHLTLLQRQAALDATEESLKNLERSVAWQVATDVLWNELHRSDGKQSLETLEKVYAYMKYLDAYQRGEDDLLEDRAALMRDGRNVFQRYETNVHGSLVQQPSYARVKLSFGDLKAA